jgi:hypothetical protein
MMTLPCQRAAIAVPMLAAPSPGSERRVRWFKGIMIPELDRIASAILSHHIARRNNLKRVGFDARGALQADSIGECAG